VVTVLSVLLGAALGGSVLYVGLSWRERNVGRRR